MRLVEGPSAKGRISGVVCGPRFASSGSKANANLGDQREQQSRVGPTLATPVARRPGVPQLHGVLEAQMLGALSV